MNKYFSIALLTCILFSCQTNKAVAPLEKDLQGTWQLFSASTVEKGDTTTTDYTGNLRMIKIVNDSHFAFLNHDINKGKDSSTAQFVAGGGRYEIKAGKYIEHLDYCNNREWEGNEFTLTMVIQNDTLTQSGVEKVEGTAIDRIIIEKYVRIK